MTIDEFIKQQRLTEHKLLHMNDFNAQARNAGIDDSLRLLSSAYNPLTQAFDLNGLATALQSCADALLQTQIRHTNMIQITLLPSLMSGLEDSLRSLASTTQAMSSSMLTAMNLDAQSYAYESIAHSLLVTLASVGHYIHEDQREELEKLEQTAEPIIEPHGKQRLSLSDLLTIISLLFTLYFGIISSAPDERINRIIAQNETIINQNDEIIELEKEDEDLRDVLYHLTDSINLLTDEVESLREELDSIETDPIPECQDDTEDSQQQDSDAQD